MFSLLLQLMPLREPKRPCRELIQNSRVNPPPLITDHEKPYCSCPPFECICLQNIQTNIQYNNNSPTSTYQTPQNIENYWSPNIDHIPQYTENNVNLNHYDFSNINADLFQPEEIFQLDQPLKPDFIQQETGRSPPTLLDLGSGTIHREYKTENYWPQNVTNMVNDDSNTSTNSRLYNSSPENSQMSLSQNDNTNYLTKIEDVYTMPKYDYYNQNTEQDYKNQHFFDITDTKLFFDESVNQADCDKNFVRYQDKFETPQFVDYTSLLCDNKLTTNDIIFNELDFKFTNNLTNVHYPDSFDGIVTQQ